MSRFFSQNTGEKQTSEGYFSSIPAFITAGLQAIRPAVSEQHRWSESLRLLKLDVSAEKVEYGTVKWLLQREF